jgi:hypothetical protein
MVTVTPGTTCAQVTFRNRQVFVANAQCADGYDNDGDGFTDYPQDQGCSSATDNDEYNSTFVPQCSDNVDNDGDGLKDFPQDTGCESAVDNNEQNGVNPAYVCSDNVDNDGDGLKDYPQDPGCSSATDADETNVIGTFACNDNIDNDGDGLKDFPQEASPKFRGAGAAAEGVKGKAPFVRRQAHSNAGDGSPGRAGVRTGAGRSWSLRRSAFGYFWRDKRSTCAAARCACRRCRTFADVAWRWAGRCHPSARAGSARG